MDNNLDMIKQQIGLKRTQQNELLEVPKETTKKTETVKEQHKINKKIETTNIERGDSHLTLTVPPKLKEEMVEEMEKIKNEGYSGSCLSKFLRFAYKKLKNEPAFEKEYKQCLLD